MSTSATPAPNPPHQDLGANQFCLNDASSNTLITFNPVAPGPLIAGQPVGGSRLEYKGEEGSFVFSGDQIQRQDGPLGCLISVTLRPNADTGALILTLILPTVAQAGMSGQLQPFKTIAIKTRTRGFVAPVGADRTYTVVQLDGQASTVAMPL